MKRLQMLGTMALILGFLLAAGTGFGSEPAHEVFVSSMATPVGFHGIVSITNAGPMANTFTVWWTPHGTPPPTLPLDLIKTWTLEPGHSMMIFPPDVEAFGAEPTAWTWAAAIVSRGAGLVTAGYFYVTPNSIAVSQWFSKDPDEVLIDTLFKGKVMEEPR